jgi:hypothetical protein
MLAWKVRRWIIMNSNYEKKNTLPEPERYWINVRFDKFFVAIIERRQLDTLFKTDLWIVFLLAKLESCQYLNESLL